MDKKILPLPFVEDNSVEWSAVGEGVERKIMNYDEHLMLVKVRFRKDAIGAPHQHYHAQVSYVSKGKFEVVIDGNKKVLQAGDMFQVSPHLVHGVVCLEEGELIDIFTPYREDFVNPAP